MFERHLFPVLQARARQMPVVTLTGPRQSGKTTLCRMAFPDKPYSNLERPDVREFARADPQGFLAQFPDGAVIDEVQRVPDLHFYRDSAGNEADLVLEYGAAMTLAEIKSAQTVSGDAMRSIANIRRGLGQRVAGAALIYGGSEAQRRSEYDVVPCAEIRRWLGSS